MAVINIQVPLTDSLIKEIAKEVHNLNLADSEKVKKENIDKEKEKSGEVFYSVKQVANKIGVHPFTITRYIRLGLITAKKAGKSWRISQTNLNKYLQTDE